MVILRRVLILCLIIWLLYIKVSLFVVCYSWIKYWIDCGCGGGWGCSFDCDYFGVCLFFDFEKEVGGRILWVFIIFFDYFIIKIIFISIIIGM